MENFREIKLDLIRGNTDTLKQLLDSCCLSFDKDTYFEIVSEIVRMNKQKESFALKRLLLNLELDKHGIKFRDLMLELETRFCSHDFEKIEEAISTCEKVADFRGKTFDADLYKYKLDLMKYDDSLDCVRRREKISLKDKLNTNSNNYQLVIKYASKLKNIEGVVDITAEHRLAKAYFGLGDYDKAIEFCNQALEKRDLSILHQALALIYKDQGDFTSAICECKKVLAKSDHYFPYLLMTDCYLGLGEVEEALTTLKRVRDISSTNNSSALSLIEEKIVSVEKNKRVKMLKI